MMSGRDTALHVLIACRKDGAWANGVLKEYARRDNLDARETALASRLCYGVLQNRYKLDFYLKQLLTGKLKNLHPAVRDILHIGLYQLFEMDKIPDAAIVNEAVRQAKTYCKRQQGAAGLINGVLRNAVRSKDTLKQPETLQDRYSHPQNLINLLTAYVGADRVEPMLQANNMAVATVAQVNTLKTTPETLQAQLEAEGVTVQLHPWLENCFILSNTGNLEKLESFQNGFFYIQDAAAKLSVLCAGVKPGDQVLDCCAAPGGKSFAALIQGAKSVISCDIHHHKTGLIQAGAERLGFENLQAFQQDAAVACPQWVGQKDVVICDVPCSGYGIIRKKPDIRYKDPDTMQELPKLQLEILTNQAQYVKPGGVLLYSTCTLVRRENEGVVEKFLKKNPEFTLEKLNLPKIFPENTTGMLTLVPGEYDTDGFFICRLRRNV